jgi:alpha-amylase/alpha-mannosidase (GH57 family)
LQAAVSSFRGEFPHHKIMKKFVCIHGHFYQPPRENPWLEAVELQDSASPYHDWNERITAECYSPNAHARFVDGEGRIERISSNYSKMSFNFGPTLLSWLKDKAPDVHQAILDADKEGQQRFSGHGPALAQCYNHMIMPLANRRDKFTQVRWGIRDFEFRFGRPPEGMWLPECAADNESLDVLAELGIKFTILSPFQAKRVRPLEGGEWRDVNGGKVDPKQPYLVKLPSGRTITVFFYDGPVSQAVAFEKLLDNGERFAGRITGAFLEEDRNQLVHLATDGESYGHHHHFGEMALAYALHVMENSPDTRLTIYGEYLEQNPPIEEAEIHEPSAWSCSHGVERWRSNCGCNSGGRPGWNQNWRKPLREALDWLRDQLAPLYESKAGEFLNDPWKTRDEYINVILDRNPENIQRFLNENAKRQLSEADEVTVLRLLEMQRHAMLMYTSCGWFFDELSGIETVQVIHYAARAIQLANDLLHENLEPRFLELLAKAKSNLREHRDGRHIYEKWVRPAITTRETVGAHYAVSSLFESYPDEARIYSFKITQLDRQLFTAGHARLAIGRLKIASEITRNSDLLAYSVLHLGDHNLTCGVRPDGDQKFYETMLNEMRDAFQRADFAEIVRLTDQHFGQGLYTIKNLFRDEQRKVLNQILTATRDDIYNTYHLITDRYAPMMRFLAGLGVPPLPQLEAATRFVLNGELRRQFENGEFDLERVRSLLTEIEMTKVPLDTNELNFAVTQYLERMSEQFQKTPDDLALLKRLTDAASAIKTMPLDPNLLKSQNTYYALLQARGPEFRERAENGDEQAREWLTQFTSLGEALGFRIDKLQMEHGLGNGESRSKHAEEPEALAVH